MGNNTQHGHSKSGTRGRTPTYNSWHAMWRRTTNPNHHAAHNYSRRGIRVCNRWRDFTTFLSDMGERPEGTTLDRIDNDGNYEPGNCRWARKNEQAKNRRTATELTAYGVTMSQTEWSRSHGVRIDTMRLRLDRGWSPERAVVPHFTDKELDAHA